MCNEGENCGSCYFHVVATKAEYKRVFYWFYRSPSSFFGKEDAQHFKIYFNFVFRILA